MSQPEHPASQEQPTMPQLPAWQWDSKNLALRPRCPVCDGRLITSGKRLTCLIVGFRHYDQPTDPLVDHVLGLLSPPAT